MIAWLQRKVARVRARLRERNELGLEILALRHQIAVLRRTGTRRPRFSASDRLLWVLLSRWWPGWRGNLTIVQPETVLRWRRLGWSLLRRFGRGRRWRGGRPRIASEIRDLIIRMARENFLWGAPRIHGELLKLGYDVSQATVSRYLPGPGGRSLTWRTFLRNQALGIGLAKPFAAREAADRLVLTLRSRVECTARYVGQSLTEVRSAADWEVAKAAVASLSSSGLRPPTRDPPTELRRHSWPSLRCGAPSSSPGDSGLPRSRVRAASFL